MTSNKHSELNIPVPFFFCSFLRFVQAVQMYKPGFMPKYMTPLDGLKVYRNIGSGIFVHRCNNINIVNGLFADNDLAIDIDRAEGIEVNDSVIIGESESFRTLTARQTTVQPACRFDGTLKGIDLYTWKHATEYAGAKISNVDISGFGDRARCEKPTTISFDQLVSLKQSSDAKNGHPGSTGPHPSFTFRSST